MADNSRKRHIAKAITWRIVGSVDTFMLSWLISGNPLTGLKIGFAEVLTKMVLYYAHERVWFKAKVKNSKTRHLLKAVSWRVLGTLDTMTLAWIITGDPYTGLQIGITEVLTKMVLYYLHERAWYQINFGLDDRKNKQLK
ncbi:hypothetical protein I215_15477 [Galbibacter marinus]|uniref:DUF2061 domain-containing protein n=1 Tax=Galbibacter marinus TaxID=555500 RepID=K2QGN9_9FLAO|nr:DUF2061 domain-containing protein [Galbibacter marinus]EKF53847.1 hypothetical protein I215_15477 [Galbibacter marinus]